MRHLHRYISCWNVVEFNEMKSVHRPALDPHPAVDLHDTTPDVDSIPEW